MSGHDQSHHVYRAYLINDLGRIVNSHYLNCENDEQAIEEARRLVSCYGVQLWDRARMIASFSPLTSEAPAIQTRPCT